jgi:hypothetical protein
MSHFANKQSHVIGHFHSTVDEDYCLRGYDTMFIGNFTDMPEDLAASICNNVTEEQYVSGRTGCITQGNIKLLDRQIEPTEEEVLWGEQSRVWSP